MTAAAPASAGAQPSGQPSAGQSGTPTKTEGTLIPSTTPAASPATPVSPPGDPQQPFTWPDWVPEQFRHERISDSVSRPLLNESGVPQWETIARKASESWKNTKTMLSEKHKYLGAPEADDDGNVKYEFRIPAGLENTAAAEFHEDPLWKGLTGLAKEMNLNQSAVDKLSEMYVTTQVRNIEQQRESEMMKLRRGGWSDERLTSLGDYFEKTFDLPEQVEVFRAMCSTSEGVLLFDSLMNKMLTTKMLPSEGQAPATTDPLEAWRVRNRDPRGKADPRFQAETDAMLQEILKRHPEYAADFR